MWEVEHEDDEENELAEKGGMNDDAIEIADDGTAVGDAETGALGEREAERHAVITWRPG